MPNPSELIEQVREMVKRPDLYVAELDVVALLAHLERTASAMRLLRRAHPYCIDSDRLYDDIAALLKEPKCQTA